MGQFIQFFFSNCLKILIKILLKKSQYFLVFNPTGKIPHQTKLNRLPIKNEDNIMMSVGGFLFASDRYQIRANFSIQENLLRRILRWLIESIAQLYKSISKGLKNFSSYLVLCLSYCLPSDFLFSLSLSVSQYCPVFSSSHLIILKQMGFPRYLWIMFLSTPV